MRYDSGIFFRRDKRGSRSLPGRDILIRGRFEADEGKGLEKNKRISPLFHRIVILLAKHVWSCRTVKGSQNDQIEAGRSTFPYYEGVYGRDHVSQHSVALGGHLEF